MRVHVIIYFIISFYCGLMFHLCCQLALWFDCIILSFWLSIVSYYWYLSKSMHWPTPRHLTVRCRLNTNPYNKTKETISIFPLWTFHLYGACAYGVYIFQLIRYSRTCGSYHDFLDRGLLLTIKLLHQGFLVVMMKTQLRKLYGSQHDLVNPLWNICVTISSCPH